MKKKPLASKNAHTSSAKSPGRGAAPKTPKKLPKPGSFESFRIHFEGATSAAMKCIAMMEHSGNEFDSHENPKDVRRYVDLVRNCRALLNEDLDKAATNLLARLPESVIDELYREKRERLRRKRTR